MGCGIDPTCQVKDFLNSAVGDALTNAADAVLQAVGKSIASLGTVWVSVGTPNLTGGGGQVTRAPGEHAAHAGGVEMVLGYATWIGFGVAVLSLILIGVRLASLRREEAGVHVDRVLVVLGGVLIIGSATGIVSRLLPAMKNNASPAVAYLQNSLFWYMAGATVLSVIIGGARMAWEQRAEPGRDLLRSLFTLIVVAGAGVTVMSLLVAAADSFSIWIIDGALDCDITNKNGTCFGGNMTALLALANGPTSTGLGAILIIVLGLAATLASLVQIVLMLARSGMLVILAGILPTAAAATNTELGRTWFTRAVGWSLAFILYKPAAAIVYAAAFKLAGTNVFRDDGSGLISVLVGVMTLCFALVALPALMRFTVPVVGTLAGGGGAGSALAMGAAVLPTGAIQTAGRLGSTQSGASMPSGEQGPTTPPGAGPGGSHGPGGTPGPAGGPGTTGAQGGPGSAGATGAGGSTGAVPASGGASGAAGGAGAGAAAAGPAGAALVAADAVKAAGVAAQGAASAAAGSATGEGGGGPSGSR